MPTKVWALAEMSVQFGPRNIKYVLKKNNRFIFWP